MSETIATGTEAIIFNAALARLKRRFTESQSVTLANLMVAQSKHETADYTSAVFKANNNAFGYKEYKGSTYQLLGGTRSPEANNYAKYASVADSTKEVADWLGRRSFVFASVSSPEGYAKALKDSAYYGDPLKTYSAGLSHYFKSFTSTAGGSGLGLILSAVLVFFC